MGIYVRWERGCTLFGAKSSKALCTPGSLQDAGQVGPPPDTGQPLIPSRAGAPGATPASAGLVGAQKGVSAPGLPPPHKHSPSQLPPSSHPGVYLPGDVRINEDKEVENTGWVTATKGDIVCPGRGQKGLGRQGHFDAVWMKREGGEERRRSKRGRGRHQNLKDNKTSSSWDTSQDGLFI